MSSPNRRSKRQRQVFAQAKEEPVESAITGDPLQDDDIIAQGQQSAVASTTDSNFQVLQLQQPPQSGSGGGRRGRPRKNVQVEIQATPTVPDPVSEKPPKKKPNPKSAMKVRTLSFPVNERDEEIVECRVCHVKLTFRDFRLHNLELHYNLAMTTDDTTRADHKFYESKIRELARLKKLAKFACPNCPSSYKSPLGLAYHLESCGKSPEEIEFLKIECSICHKKFFSQNLVWHKKSQHAETQEPGNSIIPENLRGPGQRARKSAIKARETMQQLESENNEDELRQKKHGAEEEDWFSSIEARRSIKMEADEYDVDEDYASGELPPPPTEVVKKLKVKPSRPSRAKTLVNKQQIRYNKDDLIMLESIQVTIGEGDDTWTSPKRNYIDLHVEQQLKSIANDDQGNKLIHLESEKVMASYLPSMSKSHELRTKTLGPMLVTTGFHRLKRFESEEVVDSVDHNFISFTGGSVSAMAWHPSGRILAISSMKDMDEDPDLLIAQARTSSVLIYCQFNKDGCPDTAFSLELILALEYGYVNHMKWCNWWPACVDDLLENKSTESLKEGGGDKIGYLACAMEDSTVRVFSLNNNDFCAPLNFPQRKSKYRMYKKCPEVTLSIDASTVQVTGQCTAFDWHEEQRYIVAGYASGLLAVFDLTTKSSLLRKQTENNSITLYPFWLVKGHVLPVRSIVMDPTNSRYFSSGSMDRYMKTFDIFLRLEIESKYIGSILDMSWIRGWMHFAVSTEMGAPYGNANTSQHNHVRFYQVGSSKGWTNCTECFNVTSISFSEGMTAQATETGKVNVTYYDAFWRENDYDRNKRKKNCVIVCNISVDEDSILPLPSDPDSPNFNEAFEDPLKIEQQPKLVLAFLKDRNDSLHLLNEEPSPQEIENYIRYNSYIRINKISWNPAGNHLAIGYKNGLFAIVPASFSRLFEQDYIRPGPVLPKSTT